MGPDRYRTPDQMPHGWNKERQPSLWSFMEEELAVEKDSGVFCSKESGQRGMHSFFVSCEVTGVNRIHQEYWARMGRRKERESNLRRSD